MSRPSRRRRAPKAIVVVGLVGLSILGAACGTSASPSPVPSSSPVPGLPSSPAASPAASPVRSQSVADLALVEAAVAALNADPFVGRIEQEATVAIAGAGASSIVATITADLNGDDMSFILTISGAGQESETEMIVVGDLAYVREQGGEWQTAPASVVADSLDGMRDNLSIVDDPATLAVVGRDDVDGRTLNHLVAVGDVPYQPSTGGSGRYDSLELWVADDGTPVRAEASFSATSGGTSAAGSYTMEFSNVGGPVVIEAPPVAG